MERPKFYLNEINSIDKLQELFIEKWNWEYPKITDLYVDLPDDIINKLNKYLILGEREDFKIIFFDISNLDSPAKSLKSFERKIIYHIKREGKINIENCIFVFSVNNFNYLDFVKAEKIGNNIRLKRFFISPENRDKLRTPCEQLEKLKLIGTEISYSNIKNKIEEAFSVEAVTEKFYKEYIEIFNKIKTTLIRQKVEVPVEEKEAKLRNFIHQILNRIMFLYFVQKRGCFGGDKNFLANFWDFYKTNLKGKNEFHQNWLNVLFFEALSRPSWLYPEKSYLGKFNEVLKHAPYLNGGLFEQNDLDKIGWIIPDELFDDIFEFFESYNFTIEESTPFDIEIAINPEMLGNIYEHLVNIEEQEEQARAGIFYTPKVEIELMIRRSLVEFLFNKTKINKEKLYKFIFPEFGEEIENPFTLEEAEKVLKELDEIFILDPACGSGHYLVVALQILYQLKEILWNQLNHPHSTKYEEKKKIVERNIYGNDIKEWAVEVAKLRLWLDLFVDAEDEVLENQMEPILPNLNFKIRCGDSLLQRLGGEIIPIRRIKNLIKNKREDIKHLIQKKEHVYKTSNPEEYKKTLYLEKKILQNSLSDWITEIKQEIQKINSQLTKLKEIAEFNREELIKQKEYLDKIKRKEDFENKLKNIEKMKEELSEQKEAPMLWDLSFAEVFQIKNGFDIVIANPPYVHSGRIEDLTGFYSKKEYKEKLIEQILQDWSYNFEGQLRKPPFQKENFDKKSDLYVYFYLKGLKLLNPDGVLCYISSNSWLDVGYGAKMQEILLKRAPIIAIYDNLAKRSFKHADINTIIALMKAPKDKDFDEEIKTNDVRFVNFKKPFEEIMYSEIFIGLEKNENLKEYPEGKRRETEIYRLHIINQRDLYEYGRKESTGKRLIGTQREGEYIGNKWGGKYLRAPEIYWKILEKGKGKLVKLGDIAEVSRGFTTGANEFFYLKPIGMSVKEVMEIAEKNPDALIPVRNGAGWEGEIEARFLKPVIKSPRELKTIIVRLEDLSNLVFMCHEDKKKLVGTKALEYIRWGEKQGYQNRPTCRSRARWWDLGEKEISEALCMMSYNNRHIIWVNSTALVDARFYDIFSKYKGYNLGAALNSVVTFLCIELNGRVNLGEGALDFKVYEASEIFIPSPEIVNLEYPQETKNNVFTRPIYDIFTELGFDPSKPIREQEPNPLPDRKALDDIVFDALGLTEEERKEVYWAVAELVKNRLEKAKSL